MRIILVTIFIFLASVAFSQTPYFRYPVEKKVESYPRSISAMWANDIFFQSDRYFTNGVQIEYHDQKLSSFPLTMLLYNPLVEADAFYSLTIRHDIFTPRNVLGIPALTDRPFAGVLMFGIKAKYYKPGKLYSFSTEFQLGLMGKYAGGEFMQNGIHVLLPASEPIPGWGYQINHDACINYIFNFGKQILQEKKFYLDAVGDVRIGLPYTDFAGGLRVRIGNVDNFYTPKFLLNTEQNYFYFFAETRLKMVMYDATLQGGLFNENNLHTINTINAFVGELNAGVAMRFRNYQLTIGARMHSSKFKDALPHRWAYFTFAYLF